MRVRIRNHYRSRDYNSWLGHIFVKKFFVTTMTGSRTTRGLIL